MLRLAMPVLVEQLLIMLVGLVDTWLTGQFLGENRYLAAIGLMSYILWMLPSMFAALAIGATAMVSRFVGAKQARRGALVTNQALMMGAVVAIAVTIAAFFFGNTFVRIMQLPEEASPLAARYLMFLVPIIPAIMIEEVGIACLRGAGDTMSGFVAMAIMNVSNICVSTLLVVGVSPFPELGWDGLAIGTASAHALGAVIILGLLVRGRAGLRLGLSSMLPRRDMILRLLRIGLPGGLDVAAVMACHLWYVAIINAVGPVAAAAHSLGVRIESIAYLPGHAFQVAAATMAGQFLGARDYTRASRSVLMACAVGGGLMVFAGITMFFGGNVLTDLFLGGQGQTAQTAATTASLLKIVSLSMPSLALVMILTGALRGAGDTRWPLVITFVGLLGIRIPLAYLFAYRGVTVPFTDVVVIGVYGAWWAMVIDVFVRGCLVGFRFWQGGWKKTKV